MRCESFIHIEGQKLHENFMRTKGHAEVPSTRQVSAYEMFWICSRFIVTDSKTVKESFLDNDVSRNATF